jgi:RhoGAP domain
MKPFKLEEYTAHDVASVLKSILSDLPEPLLCEVCTSVQCDTIIWALTHCPILL